MSESRSAPSGSPVKPLLEIKNLQVGFQTQNGLVPAVNGINITLMPGQTLAIVGESGSGKSTTAHAIINLLPGSGRITGGEVLFEGRDLSKLNPKQMEEVRGRLIGFVPQDPMSNLNPVWRRRSVRTGSPRARTSSSTPSACSRRPASPTPTSGCASSRTSSPAECASAC
jgi:ABC-type glutathione transport system ATPase component